MLLLLWKQIASVLVLQRLYTTLAQGGIYSASRVKLLRCAQQLLLQHRSGVDCYVVLFSSLWLSPKNVDDATSR
jgi:hypothetical protein